MLVAEGRLVEVPSAGLIELKVPVNAVVQTNADNGVAEKDKAVVDDDQSQEER